MSPTDHSSVTLVLPTPLFWVEIYDTFTEVVAPLPCSAHGDTISLGEETCPNGTAITLCYEGDTQHPGTCCMIIPSTEEGEHFHNDSSYTAIRVVSNFSPPADGLQTCLERHTHRTFLHGISTLLAARIRRTSTGR